MKNNQKKKILYIVTQSEWGGAQKYVYDLATSSEAKNYDISVAVGSIGNRVLLDKLKEKGVKTLIIENLVREISPVKDILAVFEMKRLYQKIKPDVIHLNSTKAGVIGSISAKICSMLHISSYIVYTVHGWVFNEPLSPIRKRFYLWAEKLTSQWKNKMLCISEFDRQIALKNKIAPEKKLVAIYNGININSLKFWSKEEAKNKLFKTNNLQSSTDSFIVGTIANFYATKDLVTFIEAINLLVNSQNIPVIALVIGDGDLRPQLENLIANYNLKNNFLLLGKKEDAVQYLKAFDAYICSSVKEGFPYTILEAMAAELPIISTDVGGIPEMIKDQESGLLIKPKQTGQLASLIKMLFNDAELRTRLGQKAKDDVTKQFNLENNINKTFQQYQ